MDKKTDGGFIPLDTNVSGELTVNDVLIAQQRSIKNLDKNKNCTTCKYELKKQYEKPCSNCINSFIGIVFTPSNWESR